MSASTGGRTTAERNRLGNRHDQQRAFGVRDLRDGRNVFNDAEEVRALDQNGRGLFGHRSVQRRKIDAAGLRVVANNRRRQTLMLRISRDHLAILRVNRRGDYGLAAPRYAHGHHHRFRGSG